MKPYPEDWQPIWLDSQPSKNTERYGYGQKFSLYGLTKEAFLELSERQGHKCGACGVDASESPYRLAVDHDHTTNEIRGLLCLSCNTALGWLEDSPEKAEGLAAYLRAGGTGVFIPETGSKATLIL